MRTYIAVFAALLLSGCGGVGGGIPFDTVPKASGVIHASVNGVVLSQTQSAPTSESGSFAIDLSEGNYPDFFTAAVTAYSAPTTGPCLQPSAPSNSKITMSQVAAPALDSRVSTSPCVTGTDVEAITIKDNLSHSITVYVQRSP